jgi:hypothetical protein
MFHRLKSWFSKATKSFRKPVPRTPSCRPGLEALEDRLVLSAAVRVDPPQGVSPISSQVSAGTSQENDQTFVSNLYRAVLDREGSTAEVAAWVGYLGRGGSRQQVARAFWEAPEHRLAQVKGDYTIFLNRSASNAENFAWVKALLNGRSEEDVAVGFLTSKEYQTLHSRPDDYVHSLYHNVLGREASSAEVTTWTNALAQGVSREQVARDFLESREKQAQALDSLYHSLLVREEGFVPATNKLPGTLSPEPFVSEATAAAQLSTGQVLGKAEEARQLLQDPSTLVGMAVAQARQLVEGHGLTFRVLSGGAVKSDLMPGRVDVTVRAGKVETATTG